MSGFKKRDRAADIETVLAVSATTVSEPPQQ
jgi:hypothetical protein